MRYAIPVAFCALFAGCGGDTVSREEFRALERQVLDLRQESIDSDTNIGKLKQAAKAQTKLTQDVLNHIDKMSDVVERVADNDSSLSE